MTKNDKATKQKKIRYSKSQIQIISEFRKILNMTKRTAHLNTIDAQFMIDCYSEYFDVKVKRIECYSSSELFNIYAIIKNLVKDYDKNNS